MTDSRDSEGEHARLWLRVEAMRFIARDTLAFELAAPGGEALPGASPGAHIGLALPGGLRRQYSLLHADSAPRRYEIAVKRDAASRGGSTFMHEQLRVGAILEVEPPRNSFPLDEAAPESIFFAGGIGITPIHSMLERLAGLGRRGVLHYACRERADLGFLRELSAICSLQVHVDMERGGQVLDIAGRLRSASRNAHLYCCGPTPMLKAFEQATRDWPAAQVHLESFAPRQAAAREGGFTVFLARTGRELEIPAGCSILSVLRDAGLEVSSSCEEGVCAACEVSVIEGLPDHRDSVLSPAERASNRTMMICVSGSKSRRLVLDL